MYIVLNKQNSIEIFSFDLNFFTECSLGTIIPKYLHWKEGNHMFMYLNMQAFKKKIVMHEYEKYIHVKLKIPQKYHVLLSFFLLPKFLPLKSIHNSQWKILLWSQNPLTYLYSDFSSFRRKSTWVFSSLTFA